MQLFDHGGTLFHAMPGRGPVGQEADNAAKVNAL